MPKPIGNETMREGVAVHINPSFSVQEMPPAEPDLRRREHAEYRVKHTDNYIEITLRRSGERIRVLIRP